MPRGNSSFWTEQRVTDLRKLAEEGRNPRACGAILGCTRNAALSKMRREGLMPPVAEKRTVSQRHCTLMRVQNPPPRPAPSIIPAPAPQAALPPPKVIEPPPQLAEAVARPQFSAPVEVAPPASSRKRERKILLDLEEGDCRWPFGDPQEAGFHFCAAAKFKAMPYCEEHAMRAFEPPLLCKRARDPKRESERVLPTRIRTFEDHET